MIKELSKKKSKLIINKKSVLTVAYSLLFIFSLIYGTYDIICVNQQVKTNENIISEAVNKSNFDISINDVKSKTKYSVFKDIVYVNVDSSSVWPNVDMAKYYGIDSIIGE